MLNLWALPRTCRLGEREFDLHTDYRDILEILQYLQDRQLPEGLRWQIALGLFYRQEVPEELFAPAAEYLTRFLTAGQPGKPGPKLLDWGQDAPMLAAEINKAAGREIRQEPYVHWWTFLGWFHGIGQGQLSTVVGIRQKLALGQRLEDWERDFYRRNRDLVDLPRQETPEEQAEKQRLERLLG